MPESKLTSSPGGFLLLSTMYTYRNRGGWVGVGWSGISSRYSSVGTLGELRFSVFYLCVLSYIIFTLVYMRSYTNHIYKKHIHTRTSFFNLFLASLRGLQLDQEWHNSLKIGGKIECFMLLCLFYLKHR